MRLGSYELKLEKRTSATDLSIDTIVARATGNNASVLAVAAVEIASGLYGRVFASARVEPEGRETAGVTPIVLEMIGRSLIRRGECLFQIVVRDGVVRLLPAASFSVTGDAESWSYEVSIPGPSNTFSRQLDAASVLHFRIGNDPREPWRGRSPVSYASVSADLLSFLEKRLSEEASGVVGYVLPTPTESGDANPGTEGGNTGLEQRLKNLGGQVALVPSMTSEWQGTGSAIKSQNDWQAKRLGMNPPESEVVLRSEVGNSILNSCGVPVELVSKGEGTASREAFRRFLHSTVSPIGKLVEQELSAKLEQDITLDFSDLFASDVQGRARAFQSLVKSGMGIAEAAAVTGLIGDD